MFTISSKVVHPLHGLGTVEAIETQTILGKETRFWLIFFPELGLRMMVNTRVSGHAEKLRQVIHKDTVDELFDYLQQSQGEGPARAAWRMRINLERLKSGDVFQVCDVIKNLVSVSERVRKFSPKEKTLLDQAVATLASELAFVEGCSIEEMKERLMRTAKGLEKKPRSRARAAASVAAS
ncbi:MAG: hypothetical protein HY319_21825 [Armatimonadetes bacterium]|nr:hypothetical protein [Armatimonadota bacterium]